MVYIAIYCVLCIDTHIAWYLCVQTYVYSLMGYMYMYMYVYYMYDGTCIYMFLNERRKKEASKVKQTNKAKQHSTPNMYM